MWSSCEKSSALIFLYCIFKNRIKILQISTWVSGSSKSSPNVQKRVQYRRRCKKRKICHSALTVTFPLTSPLSAQSEATNRKPTSASYRLASVSVKLYSLSAFTQRGPRGKLCYLVVYLLLVNSKNFRLNANSIRRENCREII